MAVDSSNGETYPHYTCRQYSLRRTNMFHYKDCILNDSHKDKGCHNLGHSNHDHTLQIENKVLVRIEEKYAIKSAFHL